MSKFDLSSGHHIKEHRARSIAAPFNARDIIVSLAGKDNVRFYALTAGECKKHPLGCPVTSMGFMRSDMHIIGRNRGLVVYFHGPVQGDFKIADLRELKPKKNEPQIDMHQFPISHICSGAPNPYHSGWEVDHVNIEHGRNNWKITFVPGNKNEVKV